MNWKGTTKHHPIVVVLVPQPFGQLWTAPPTIGSEGSHVSSARLDQVELGPSPRRSAPHSSIPGGQVLFLFMPTAELEFYVFKEVELFYDSVSVKV